MKSQYLLCIMANHQTLNRGLQLLQVESLPQFTYIPINCFPITLRT